MDNNDILRRVRFILNYQDPKMINIFELADYKVNREQVIAWLKREDDEQFQAMSDYQLASFLNGLISEKRGKQTDLLPETEKKLTNNIIFKKLRVAFDLRDDGVIKMLKLAGFSISKSELGAFFRKPDHKHYRNCNDQIIRMFLKGLQIQHRGDFSSKSETVMEQALGKKSAFKNTNTQKKTYSNKKREVYKNPNLKQPTGNKERDNDSSQQEKLDKKPKRITLSRNKS